MAQRPLSVYADQMPPAGYQDLGANEELYKYRWERQKMAALTMQVPRAAPQELDQATSVRATCVNCHSGASLAAVPDSKTVFCSMCNRAALIPRDTRERRGVG
jgi:hypothetical protein